MMKRLVYSKKMMRVNEASKKQIDFMCDELLKLAKMTDTDWELMTHSCFNRYLAKYCAAGAIGASLSLLGFYYLRARKKDDER